MFRLMLTGFPPKCIVQIHADETPARKRPAAQGAGWMRVWAHGEAFAAASPQTRGSVINPRLIDMRFQQIHVNAICSDLAQIEDIWQRLLGCGVGGPRKSAFP